jgi:hypothetical protein
MLVSRSIEECHLYMELHPCECGAATEPWHQHSLSEHDGRFFSTYEGTCPACDRARRFEFEVPGPAGSGTGYGDPGSAAPSQIIDPGEFLASSQDFASGVPPRPEPSATEDELIDCADAIEFAVEGVVEALKFVPSGAPAVPAEAFTSGLGADMYKRDPAQFGRDRLELELADYQRIRAAYAAVLGE